KVIDKDFSVANLAGPGRAFDRFNRAL
ncbi:MAG: hypothetical protein RLZZ140_1216, partial [Pseudomonadota bacterium]